MLIELTYWLFLLAMLILLANYLWIPLVGIFVLYFLTTRSLEKISVRHLQNKAVLITGCDTGFGHNLALKCLRHGMPVFAACLTDNGANRLYRVAINLMPEAKMLLHSFRMDITNDESVWKARQMVGHQLGNEGLWAIVNNAGISSFGWDDLLTTDDYQKTFNVNTLGAIRVTHAFSDLVKKSKGRVVIMSSILGKMPLAMMGTYCVSKFATSCYTDVIRTELAPYGVIVIGLEPGFYHTILTDVQIAKDKFKKMWDDVPKNLKEEYGENFLAYSKKILESFDKFGSDNPEKVVSAYFTAVTSAFPRRRWQVGYAAALLHTPLSFLPSRWLNGIWRFYFETLNRRPKPNLTKKPILNELHV